jgi:hypothetical protein
MVVDGCMHSEKASCVLYNYSHGSSLELREVFRHASVAYIAAALYSGEEFGNLSILSFR